MEQVAIADLERALTAAGIPTADVRLCAASVMEDLKRYDIADFRLRSSSIPQITIVEYEFGETGYSTEKARPEDSPDFKQSAHGGSQLSRDNLLFFVRASTIARTVVPELWLNPNADLKGKLKSPGQHLDTLNEFWWLSRWRLGAHIKPEHPINPMCAKKIDWQLTWDFGLPPPLTVNIEVKRRIDVLRMAQEHALESTEIFGAGLEDKNGNSKFRESTASEINVLAVTLLGEIDREVQVQAEEWLRTRTDVDAVLIFTRFSIHRSGFDVHVAPRKRDLLNQVLVRELDPLDERLHSVIERPLPYPMSQLQFLP